MQKSPDGYPLGDRQSVTMEGTPWWRNPEYYSLEGITWIGTARADSLGGLPGMHPLGGLPLKVPPVGPTGGDTLERTLRVKHCGDSLERRNC